MSEFELIRVHDASQLHDNLAKLLKNKKHIESLVVDTNTDEIRIDLSRTANMFGNIDFRLSLQSGKGADARTIIDTLRKQDAPTRGQSEELFAMLAR